MDNFANPMYDAMTTPGQPNTSTCAPPPLPPLNTQLQGATGVLSPGAHSLKSLWQVEGNKKHLELDGDVDADDGFRQPIDSRNINVHVDTGKD